MQSEVISFLLVLNPRFIDLVPRLKNEYRKEHPFSQSILAPTIAPRYPQRRGNAGPLLLQIHNALDLKPQVEYTLGVFHNFISSKFTLAI